MESRLFIIRLLVVLIMSVSAFSAAWYVYIRYQQLNEDPQTPESIEPNNPRINTAKIDRVTQSFSKRKIFQLGDSLSVYIPESDPFYSSY